MVDGGGWSMKKVGLTSLRLLGGFESRRRCRSRLVCGGARGSACGRPRHRVILTFCEYVITGEMRNEDVVFSLID